MSAQRRDVIHKVEVNVTVAAATYTAKDALHTGAILLTGCFQGHNHGGELCTITVIDQAENTTNGGLNLIFFSANPSGSTITAEADIDFLDADLDSYCLGFATVAAADYIDFADNSIACVRNVGLHMQTDLPNDRNLYMVVRAVGTPTYAATTDLRIKLFFRQD